MVDGEGMRREKGFGRVSCWKEFTEITQKFPRTIFFHTSISNGSFKIFCLPFPGYLVWLFLSCFHMSIKGYSWPRGSGTWLEPEKSMLSKALGHSVMPSNSDRDLGFFFCEV